MTTMNENALNETPAMEAHPSLSGQRGTVIAPLGRNAEGSGRQSNRGDGLGKGLIAVGFAIAGYLGGAFQTISQPSAPITYQWGAREVESFIKGQGAVTREDLAQESLRAWEAGARAQAWSEFYQKPYLQVQRDENGVTMFKAAVLERVPLTLEEKEAEREAAAALAELDKPLKGKTR